MPAASIICRRGSSLLQSRCSSFLTNQSYRCFLTDYTSSILSSSSIPSPLGLSNNVYSNRRGQILHFSQFVKANGNRTFLVNTLDLVRRLEAQGVPTKQAEAITSTITEVLNDSLENVAKSFSTKGEMEKCEKSLKGEMEKSEMTLKGEMGKSEMTLKMQMQKSEMTQDASFSKFKSEVQNSQEHHFSSLQRETAKLRADIEKISAKLDVGIEKINNDLRHEIDKVTAGQRLDLNLERARTRDELAKQNSEIRHDLATLNTETTELSKRLDREIHTSRALLEGAKFDLIKYGIGAFLSVTAIWLGIYRSFFQKESSHGNTPDVLGIPSF